MSSTEKTVDIAMLAGGGHRVPGRIRTSPAGFPEASARSGERSAATRSSDWLDRPRCTEAALA